MSKSSKGNKAYRIIVSGKVQGVGFRPFIYRTAVSLGLKGFVANSGQGAVIELEGSARSVDTFLKILRRDNPPRSAINSITKTQAANNRYNSFSIVESIQGRKVTADVPPDLCVCPDCVKDVYSARDRRFKYPFTNCTNCGPRFSIIKKLPYDRKMTTMSGFKMCPKCRAEYDNPLDRRFHAQPNACPVCGPKLTLLYGNLKTISTGPAALNDTIAFLKKGKIIAVKSIGGYQIACDAFNRSSVELLRRRKARPHKALAVMMPDLKTIKAFCRLNREEEEQLSSPNSPIVLLRPIPGTALPLDLLAPGNAYIGVMLPYTPLHKLIFRTPGEKLFNFTALVMTSGNVSDEPIIIEERSLNEKLAPIADSFLVHDRPIHNRCDDSIIYNLRGRENMFIRKSRGYVLDPVGFANVSGKRRRPVIFASGAELKNTFCFVREASAYQSQYIGDLDNLEAARFYDESFHRMKNFLAVKPAVIAHDLHPDYYSTVRAIRVAADSKHAKTVAVQHHHAHIASVLAEKNISRPVIGMAFDGNGLGTDGNVWGGECLLVDGPSFERLAHLDYFRLPGGDAAVKDIWRAALSVCRKYGLTAPRLSIPRRGDEAAVLAMIDKGLNSPLCSSMGRLFDAVAAIIGLRSSVSFEAQAAMEMESLAVDIAVKKGYNFEVVLCDDKPAFKGPAVINFKALLEGVLKDLSDGTGAGMISAKFHYTVSEMINELALIFSKKYRIRDIVLSGGVFQNKTLARLAVERLERSGLRAHFNTIVPPNDGGISLGQAWIAFQRVNHNRRQLSAVSG